MSDPFKNSTGASGARITDYNGRLLLVKPREYLPVVKTKFDTPTDAMEADLVVLDGEDGPEEVGVVRVFQSYLIASLKQILISDAHEWELGRLGTIPNKKKPGGDPSWVLNPPDEADQNLAREWLAKRPVPGVRAGEGANPFS